ncbi:MAG: 30S ribosomal protein S6 [Candidatus Harrisonbacteria bacterium]|nr:30S ribosomal protein S6 [Candidatus Harrisonbacteria bacterium]
MITSTEMNDEIKKDYEIAFLLSDQEAEKDLAQVLRSHKADFIHQKSAAEQKLSYPINKHLSAFFGFYHFKMIPENIKSLREALKLNPKILRFLLITPPVKVQKAAPAPRDKKAAAPIITNEALVEKLEEILK